MLTPTLPSTQDCRIAPSATAEDGITASERPQVFVLDCDLGSRRSVRWLLESLDYRVVPLGSYYEYDEYMDQRRPRRPGCLIAAVSGLHGDPRHARREGPRDTLPAIFLVDRPDVATVIELFRGGAFDVFETPFEPELLLERVECAVQQDIWHCAAEQQAREIENRVTRLTPREQEVMQLLREGKSIKQIAGHFEVTVQTAAKHRARLLTKLNVENDVELVNLLQRADATRRLR